MSLYGFMVVPIHEVPSDMLPWLLFRDLDPLLQCWDPNIIK